MIPLTDRAKDVIDLARREAIEMKHDHVGTEHVLLGLLREGGGIAARLTERYALQVGQVRKAITLLNPPSGIAWVTQNQIPFSGKLRDALRSAQETADKLGHDGVGIGHLFLGIIEDEESKGALLLINLGMDPKEMHREMLEVLSVKK